MIYETIVCLANSRKLGGHCVAGKKLEDNKWIRPISQLATGELYHQHIQYRDGSLPKCLDVIAIPVAREEPKFFQPENVLIAEGQWIKVHVFPFAQLDALCDDPSNFLLIEGNTDRISERYLQRNNIESSLALIRPQAIWIYRTSSFTGKKQVRARFKYSGEVFALVVTGPVIENYDLEYNQTYRVESRKLFLCVSLGEPFGGKCYKLVAAIIFKTGPRLVPVDSWD